MEDRYAALKDSIRKGDLGGFNDLLAELNIQLLQDRSTQHNEYEDLIKTAVQLGHREMAIKLLLKSLNNIEIIYEDFSWLKLFDLVSVKRASTGQILDRLKYARPLLSQDDFPLATLAHKPKYLKAAFSLGAICKNALELGSIIINSRMQFRDKMKLLQWLHDNNHVTKQIIPNVDILRLVNQSPEFKKYLQRHADSLLEQDPFDGNNILHYVTKNEGVRVSSFDAVWAILQAHFTDRQKLIAAAGQPNPSGSIPAITYLSKYLGYNSSYPREFIEALKIIVEKEEINPTWKKYIKSITHHTQTLKYTMVYFYLLQHGRSENTEQLRGPLRHITQCQDFSQLFHFIDKPKIHEKPKQQSANITINGNSDNNNVNLLDLPKELFEQIILDLAPHDLKRLYSCTKTLLEECKTIFDQDEQLWRQYHQMYFYPMPEDIIPYRTRVQRQLRLNSNWRQNKYSTVTELTGTPRLMDENWLTLSRPATEGIAAGISSVVSYWNCHMQQLSDVTVKTQSNSFITTLLDPSGSTRTPKILVGGWSGADRSYLKVIGETESPVLRNVPAYGYGRDLTNIVAIDAHSIFVPADQCMYNIEQEKSMRLELPGALGPMIYNPYNKTVVALPSSYGIDGLYYTISDLRSNKTIKLAQKTKFSMNVQFMKIIDENTMFITGSYRNHVHTRRSFYGSACAFVDLRTGAETDIITHLFTDYFGNIATSKDRLFIHSTESPVISSWHLPSRKIEWIELPSAHHTPKIGNSRYLALTEKNNVTKTFVRDYLEPEPELTQNL